MSQTDSQNVPGKKLGITGRRPVSVSQQALVKTGYFEDGSVLPLVVQPAVDGVRLLDWASSNRDVIEAHVLEYGGVLFRGFDMRAPNQFEQFVDVVSTEMLEYRERSSPRSQVSGNIYTSTDYPADQEIFLHNENSYQHTWPLKIFFCCVTAAEHGGETPIADSRKVFQRISPATRARFADKQVMYVRNFGDGFGLPWQTVFQTTDRATVENYCRSAHILVEWKDGDRLRTRAIRPAVMKHPKTAQDTWFNHATFFHVSTLDASVRDALLASFKDEDLPSNTYYGDGSPIEPEVLDELRDAYRQETVKFPWHEGDLLMLDNMLAAHGRAPFGGSRKVLVAMSEPTSATDVAS